MNRRLLENILKETGILIIDGSMSTALENRGFRTDGTLWTARALIERPDLIHEIHKDYFRAGADCGISCSYQASLPGFLEKGLSADKAEKLLTDSVRILRSARESWWREEGKNSGRTYPLCAASIGPYGAYLADGSEYSGNYDVSGDRLYSFHSRRMTLLWEAGADLLVIETQPSMKEIRIETEIAETLGADYWVSFTCPDSEHLYTGEKLSDCVQELSSGHPHLRMIGVNCVPPRNTEKLIGNLLRHTSLPVAVYPNSGEIFDPHTRLWHQPPVMNSWFSYAKRWMLAGASAVGGCCRTTEPEIRLAVKARAELLTKERSAFKRSR